MPKVYKVCGAKTRKGTPCQNRRLFSNGRCKNHGGMSTGPTTPEGRLKSLSGLHWAKDKDLSEYVKDTGAKNPKRVKRIYRYVRSK